MSSLASSQMISYKLGMGLSAVPVLLIAGSTSLPKIVDFQIQNGWLMFPYANGHFGFGIEQSVSQCLTTRSD